MIIIMLTSMSALFARGRRTAIETDACLFFTHDPVSQVYFVQKGRVELRRITESGHEMLLQTARAGQIPAEASVYSGGYHCDGVALEQSDVCAIPVSEFRKGLKDNPALHEVGAQYLAHGVQAARSRAEIRGIKTVAARLDLWLALNKTLPPKGQLRHLAAELGGSPEALYRELAKQKSQ